jgi:hypothetical protein
MALSRRSQFRKALLGRRLQDLPPFEGLGRVARDCGVDLTLYGGTASRIAMRLFHRPDEELDLFDLAPFTSDIDLEHSGSDKQTSAVRDRIMAEVPFASWFRWSLIDKEMAAAAARMRGISTTVPLRRVRFSTSGDAQIPQDTIDDLARIRVSFDRNPRFAIDRPDGEREDLEIFGLMMALNVRAEFDAVVGREVRFDEGAAMRWLAESGRDDLLRAATNPRLASRFWQLLAVRLAMVGPEDKFVSEILTLAEENGTLDGFDVDLGDLRGDWRVFSVSGFNNEFRVSEFVPELLTGKDAREALGEILGMVRSLAGHEPAAPEAIIDPAFELVALAPWISINPVRERGTDLAHDYSEGGGAFVALALRPSGALRGQARHLTAAVLPFSDIAHAAATSVQPAVGGAFGDNALWIRARIDDHVQVRTTQGEALKAALLILRATDA